MARARWLLKTEPSTYGFDDLAREKTTVWEGVSNPVALKHIGSMHKGDDLLIYHTGGERAIVGTASVVSDPYPDPKAGNPKIVVADIKVGQRLARPVTLDEIKKDKAFAGWELVRIGRLSVMPVPEAMWKRIEKLATS
jgi:predicted RNA-binding protein with PUA-like domain